MVLQRYEAWHKQRTPGNCYGGCKEKDVFQQSLSVAEYYGIAETSAITDGVCVGAKPIFFLDYIAIGKNDPVKVAELVSGVAEGCVQAGCALIGGETAEHPGTMAADDYDLAGFTVGITDKKDIIDKTKMKAGDVIVALASSGVHSNGYSLVRKVFDIEYADLGKYYDELGATLGEVLLTPTKIYVKPVLAALKASEIHGISHITGGGFYENIPRSIPDGLCAVVDKSKIVIPPVFGLLQKTGGIEERDMFNTYNMGVGMSIIVSQETADACVKTLQAAGETAYVIGEVAEAKDDEQIRFVE